jgi:hypothetical protein
VVGKVVKVKIIFCSSGGWESDGPDRVACDGGANSMLQFRLERRGDGEKYYRKMKRRQQSHLVSMERKRDTVRRRDDVGRSRGGTEEGKVRRRCQLG